MGDHPVEPRDQPTRSTSELPSIQSLSFQNLSSVLNKTLPSSSSSSSWSLWPFSSAADDLSDSIPLPSSLPEIPLSAFTSYLSSIQRPYFLFSQIKKNFQSPPHADVTPIKEIPSIFFDEDFALEQNCFFAAVCPFSPNDGENSELHQRLTDYHEIVRDHLARELSLRWESFFEVQGELQALNEKIVEACAMITGLRERLRAVAGELELAMKLQQDLRGLYEDMVRLVEMHKELKGAGGGRSEGF